MQYKTWIEISERAVVNNIRAFRSILKKNTKLFAVVKSNAYGHGLIIFSELADKYGVDGFCVDAVVEGKKLRNAGIKKPILVLGPTLPHLYKDAAAHDIAVTISNFDALTELIRSGAKTKFHIKVDTGMHRQGFYVEELNKVLQQVKSQKSPHQNKFDAGQAKVKSLLCGAYTHFATAKDILYPDYTVMQCEKFIAAKKIFLKNGFKNLVFHAAATGGTVSYPESHFDMVRIGLGLYGYFPTPELAIQHPLMLKKKLTLQPILSWHALVSEVKNLKKGDWVGYDLTEEVKEDTKAAIIPIGYWHGFPRSLSNYGEVLINGKRVRVLGRVSMDLIVVAIPKHVTVKVGDKVTFIGEDGKERIDAPEVARSARTIQYEFLTRLNPLIKRVVT